MLATAAAAARTPINLRGRSFRPLYRNLQSYTNQRTMASKATEVVPLILSAKQVSDVTANTTHIRLLDATWFMPNVKRDPLAEFQRGPRLPGAQFWDVDRIATLKDDVDNQGRKLNPLGLSHMMPTADRFAQAATEHGISPSTHVIVYDSHGVFSSPRTAFTFFAFGHRAISILDGGLPAWIAAGLPVEEGEQTQAPLHSSTDYPRPVMREELIRSYDEMVANARMGAGSPRRHAVLDARPSGRFDGTAPEPRPGLSSGHIPHSLSLPATTLLRTESDAARNTTYTTLKPQTELWRTVSDAVGGLDALDKLRQASSAGEAAVTNTCGSGMTAAILWLGLYQLGVQSSIYDESWTGYAQRKESVIDTTATEG